MKRLMTAPFVVICALVLVVSSAVAEPAQSKQSKTECDSGKQGQSYSFKFSGYFKADLIYDRARVTSGNYAIKVLEGSENDVMNITAREMRLGIDFLWKERGICTDAKLEFDFYGLGAQPSGLNTMENKAAPMLRHAYLKITKCNWSLLAGQTSDVISPLVPATVNYTVCWAQGNIGYRRPQFQVSTWANIGERSKLLATVAAARTLGHDLDGHGIDDGADAAVPTVQGRIGFESTFGESGFANLGVSGHYGREEATLTDTLGSRIHKLESWSFNADLKLSLTRRVVISGEFFVGQNLGTYFGGVLQDINLLQSEIGARGGWGMVSVKPAERLTFNAGYSFDDPDKGDFAIPEESAYSFIDMNSALFGNITFSVTDNVTAMLETMYLKTTYLRLPPTSGAFVSEEADDVDYDDIRVQFALKAAIK